MNEEKKPFFTQVLWIVIIGIGISIVVQLGYSSYSLWKKRDIVQERAAYLETLEVQQNELKKDLSDNLRPQFIEKEARNKLGLVKPGETAVIMPESSESGQNQAQTSSETHSTEPTWKLWLKLFF